MSNDTLNPDYLESAQFDDIDISDFVSEEANSFCVDGTYIVQVSSAEPATNSEKLLGMLNFAIVSFTPTDPEHEDLDKIGEGDVIQMAVTRNKMSLQKVRALTDALKWTDEGQTMLLGQIFRQLGTEFKLGSSKALQVHLKRGKEKPEEPGYYYNLTNWTELEA